MTRRREWRSVRTLTLSPASSLAVAATLEARATVRLGAATRTLRPVGNGGREGDTVSGVVALETRALLSLAVVCRERPAVGLARPRRGFPMVRRPRGYAPVKTEDAEASADISLAMCGRIGSGRGVLWLRVTPALILLTGHADCVSSSGTPACARRPRFAEKPPAQTLVLATIAL